MQNEGMSLNLPHAASQMIQPCCVPASSEEGMILQLADGTICACNAGAERILGYTIEQIQAYTFTNFPWQTVDEEGTPFPSEAHPASVALQTGKPCVNVYRGIYKPNGKLIWLLLNSQPLFKANETVPYAVVTTFTDITEQSGELNRCNTLRKQTEEALRESKLNFQTLVDTMPQIFWTANPDGWLDYYNQRWFDYTGMTLEQTQGWGWKPVLHPEEVQTCIDTWSESVRTGQPYEIEYRFRRAVDGQYRWHLGRAFPLKDEEGQILKWFGSCTDIHDQKCALEERDAALEQEQAARKEAERANRIKDEFLPSSPMNYAPP